VVPYDRDELAVTLFEESGDALFLFDPASEAMIDVNPMAQRLSGFSYAELVRMQVTYLFRSSANGGLARLRHAFLRTGLFHSQEDFLLRHRNDGVWVPVNLTVTRLHARPKTLGLITVRDISERKKFEASLLHERYLLHSLMDNIPDHIYFKDAQCRFLRINKAKADMHGLSNPEEAVNRSDFDFHSAESARQIQSDDKRVMETEQPLINQEERITDGEGREWWMSTTKLPLRDAKGQIIGTFGVSRDITENKRLEGQLRQAQKMEAVGRLAGGVAHDFNNLLTVILGYVSILLDQTQPGESIHESIRVIRSTAERAAGLTRQLLAFSRRQLLMPVVLDLNTVISDLMPMLRRLIGEDISLHTDLAESLGPLKADRNQLEQVLVNLVVNARDAMPRGGRLTIETHNESSQESGEAPCVVLTVSDTGHGMDEFTRAHLFEPFFTTKEVGKGTGLGLATVYGIVQQSGGRITVDSEPGVGTTFRIKLPQVLLNQERRNAIAANDEERSEAVAPLSAHAAQNETILLVEDEEMLRNLARIVLRKQGYTVLEAAHGGEALTICQNHEGPIDLLVTDVVMPVLGGRELVDRIVLLRPEIKVLYVSGYTEDAVVRNGIYSEKVQFLHKPFAPTTLADKVREVLDQKAASRLAPVLESV
jgi:two-component system cell cycle sensor histidine kinase/response regulator CckA